MMYGYSNNKSPCCQCMDRKGGCHSSCEKYDSYKKNLLTQKFYMYQQINPMGCRYYKEKAVAAYARQSKKRYR